jgi:hypothetical protein
MLKCILQLLCISLIGQQLLAQCNSCDSLVKSKGYYIITTEEKRKHPGLEDRVSTYRCDPNCGLVIEPPARPLFQFDGKWGYLSLRAGTNFGHLATTGLNMTDYTYNSTLQPYFSLAFDIDAPEWSGICIRAELGWKSHRFEGVRWYANRIYNRREIQATGIDKEVSFLYKYPKGNFRWFLGIGLGHERLKFNRNKFIDYYYSDVKPVIVDDNQSMDDGHLFLPLTAGMMFKNRIEFRYKMEYSKWDAGDALYNVANTSHIVSVGYRFL